jgi:RNA polymerase sigma-70 factor (ECF subfamily)
MTKPEDLDVVALYRAHAGTISRWVERLGGPVVSADREDIVQEVFIHVERLLPRFRGESSVTTWIFAITSRIVLRYRARWQLRRWLAKVIGSSLEPPAVPPTPLEELERHRGLARAHSILDGMAEKYRRVFILYEIEGLSGQEIAELTGLKLNTVWIHLHRARKLFDEGASRARTAEAAEPVKYSGGEAPGGPRELAGKRVPRSVP